LSGGKEPTVLSWVLKISVELDMVSGIRTLQSCYWVYFGLWNSICKECWL